MAAAGFLLVHKDEECAELAKEGQEASDSASSTNSHSNTRLKPKLLVGGLATMSLLALAAGVFWHKAKGLQADLKHEVLLQQQDCVDLDPSCSDRYSVGECEWNAEFMDTECRATCGTCPKASAFLPTVYTVTVPKNVRPSPESYTKCVTLEGVPVALVECPAHVTTGNGMTKIETGGFKLAVETRAATSNSTSVCATSYPLSITGWPADITFNCQAKAVLVTVGPGPEEEAQEAPYTQCVTPPLLPANCPSLVTGSNRVPPDGEPDEFTIVVTEGRLCATSTTNWYYNLAFYCQAGQEVAPSRSVKVKFGEGERWRGSCTECLKTSPIVECPALVTDFNWATQDKGPEVFSISTRYNGHVCATRVDSITECDSSLKDYKPQMWSTNFAVYCKVH